MRTKCISSPNKLNAEHAKADAAFTELRALRPELISPAPESETQRPETHTVHQTHQLSGKCQSSGQGEAAVRKCLGQQPLSVTAICYS